MIILSRWTVAKAVIDKSVLSIDFKEYNKIVLAFIGIIKSGCLFLASSAKYLNDYDKQYVTPIQNTNGIEKTIREKEVSSKL